MKKLFGILSLSREHTGILIFAMFCCLIAVLLRLYGNMEFHFFDSIINNFLLPMLATIAGGAFLYVFTGIKNKLDIPDKIAFKEISRKALNGDSDAQFNLGVMYEKGRGVKQNYEKALEWYKQADDNKHSSAAYSIANIYDKKKNYKEALEWYEKSWNPMSLFDIGFIHEKGHGVEKNYKEAFESYKSLADCDIPPAMSKIAEMYYEGKGVDKNLIEAYSWAYLAKTNSDKRTLKALKKIGKKMNEEDIKKAKERAEEWHTQNINKYAKASND